MPHWAKDLSIGARMINARAETVAERPGFRDAFGRGRRCLVPADGFYEWRKRDGPKAPKQPYTVALKDGSPMALAELWEGWRGPGGEIVRTFTTITTDANEKLRALCDRMPVILRRADWPAWLGKAPVEPVEPADLLALPLSEPPPKMPPPVGIALEDVEARRVEAVMGSDGGLIAPGPCAST